MPSSEPCDLVGVEVPLLEPLRGGGADAVRCGAECGFRVIFTSLFAIGGDSFRNSMNDNPFFSLYVSFESFSSLSSSSEENFTPGNGYQSELINIHKIIQTYKKGDGGVDRRKMKRKSGGVNESKD